MYICHNSLKNNNWCNFKKYEYMKFNILTLLLLFVNFIFAQDSLNMAKMAHIDGMPGNEYNDIWGYVDTLGQKEYAIIGSSQAINIYDVTDCSNPVLYHQEIDGNTTIWRDFKSYGDYVYGVCDQGSEGLEIINMETKVFSQNTTDFLKAHNIYVDQDNARLYVVGSNSVQRGMIIYDLSTTPENPQLLKKIRLDTLLGNTTLDLYIHDIYVKDNIAYASHGYAGYYIWDVTDVNNINLLGSTDDLPGYNHSSWPTDDLEYFYIAEEVPIGRPISIYHIINNEPYYVSSFKNPLEAPNYENNRPHNPFVKDDKLFISYYHDGLVVYDIANPTSPEFYAYYDTYLPNNGNGYSDYHGAWGVYPFLPSGCLVVSDIETGLYTLSLKANEIVQETGDLYLTDSNTGIVVKNILGDPYKLTLDDNGNIVVSAYVENSSTEVKAIDADYVLDTNGAAVYFKRSSGLYKLFVDNSGNLVSQAATTLPTSNLVNISGQDLYISNTGNGFVFTDSNGQRWKLRAENALMKAYKSTSW